MHRCKTEVQIQTFPCDSSHWVNKTIKLLARSWVTGSGFQSSDALDIRFTFPGVSRYMAAGTGNPTQEDLQRVWSSSQRELSHTTAAGAAPASSSTSFSEGLLLRFLMEHRIVFSDLRTNDFCDVQQGGKIYKDIAWINYIHRNIYRFRFGPSILSISPSTNWLFALIIITNTGVRLLCFIGLGVGCLYLIWQ